MFGSFKSQPVRMSHCHVNKANWKLSRGVDQEGRCALLHTLVKYSKIRQSASTLRTETSCCRWINFVNSRQKKEKFAELSSEAAADMKFPGGEAALLLLLLGRCCCTNPGRRGRTEPGWSSGAWTLISCS